MTNERMWCIRLSRMGKLLPRRTAGGPGGPWIRHRAIAVAFGSDASTILNQLRSAGLVESYGTGRNRHHALTQAGLSQVYTTMDEVLR